MSAANGSWMGTGLPARSTMAVPSGAAVSVAGFQGGDSGQWLSVEDDEGAGNAVGEVDDVIDHETSSGHAPPPPS